MTIPADLKYTKDHEWVKVEGDVATMGVTEFAQSELGEIVFAELPALGKAVSQGQTLCVLESTKAASDVYSPISGTVKAVNAALSDSPTSVNSDPYGQGWMVKLEKFDAAQIASLMTAEQYAKHIGK